VICDPWSKRAFSVVQMKEEMALLSSTTNGETRCEPRISLPANTDYNSDPNVPFLTADGAGFDTPETQADRDARVFVRTEL